MLSFSKNKKMHSDIRYWQDKNSEIYQNLYKEHLQNAKAQVKQEKLFYQAIQLANSINFNVWVWRPDQIENHPALLMLCSYWQSYYGDDNVYEARIPYIQVFLGKENYLPLISNAVCMPTKLENEAVKTAVQESSLAFGDYFLITFLAAREISANKSHFPELIHRTVNDKPLIKENLFFGNQQLTVSVQMLKGLKEFPQRFPSLWRYLKDQYEEVHYDIH